MRNIFSRSCTPSDAEGFRRDKTNLRGDASRAFARLKNEYGNAEDLPDFDFRLDEPVSEATLMPSSDVLKAWEKKHPGSASRFLTLMREEQMKRHILETDALFKEFGVTLRELKDQIDRELFATATAIVLMLVGFAAAAFECRATSACAVMAALIIFTWSLINCPRFWKRGA